MTPLRDGLRRIAFELHAYFRAPDQVFFTFAFPLLMFLLFTAMFSGQRLGAGADGEGGVAPAQYYLAAMITASVLLSGTQNLGIDVAEERLGGGLARLGTTPLRPVSFFIGKFGLVAITCLVQTVLLVLLATLGFGAELPADPGRWGVLLWSWGLGTACCAVLGVALSAVPRTPRAAAPVVIPTVLLLQFVSGIYISVGLLPEWMQLLAAVFPVLWIGHGMRYALLPEGFGAGEPAGHWQLPLAAAVIAAWLVAGLVCSRLTFRWSRGRS